MIVADASAVLAVLRHEEDYQQKRDALLTSRQVVMSAINAWEAAVRVEKDAPGEGVRRVEALLASAGGRIEPVSDADWRAAVDVWRRWGRPNHPANLNLADCFAYALAESRGLPLLYKGKDFPQTDIASVL